jgi:hypothetical protein
MKKIIQLIPVFLIAFLVVGYLVLHYQGKWENYPKKALFLNTYANSDDQSPGKPSWHWVMDPQPIIDDAGNHVVLVDYESNMLAIITYPGAMHEFTWAASAGQLSFNMGSTKMTIHQQNDTLLAVSNHGFQPVKTLQPGEAKSIFASLQQIASDKPKLQAAIADLLGPAATQPTTMATTQDAK